MCEPYGGWVGVGIRPPSPVAADMIPAVVRYISGFSYSVFILVGVVCLCFVGVFVCVFCHIGGGCFVIIPASCVFCGVVGGVTVGGLY